MMQQGYIKLYRQLLEWEWYNDINTKTLFLHCLLRANYEPTKWCGIKIKKGQFITSYQNLAKECGLTVRQLRTSLNRLKSTQEVVTETTHRNTIITINNWDKWQANDTQNDTQATRKRQQIKNIRNKEIEEEEYIEKNFKTFGKEYNNVYLKNNHYSRLLNACMSIHLLEQLIEEYSINIERGKEKRFDLQYPDAHYLGLMAYLKQRKKNPKIVPIEEKSHYRPA